MKGYHLSYLMKRAGLLMAAALVSSQLLGCCSWCRCDREVGGKWSIWNVRIPVAPENRYARGDGETDDAQAIQDHIDAAYEDGGGIVFFPEGKYNIRVPLRLRSGVYLKGVGGSTFDTKYFNTFHYGTTASRNALLDSLTCAIVVDSDVAISTNIIETVGPFYLSGVEDIALVGNRELSSSSSFTPNGGYGIYLATGPDSHSQAEFRNVLIYATGGTGFYEAGNQHEAFLDHVMTLQCGKNGFEFNGEGNQVEGCAAVGNVASGFVIGGTAGDRFYDVDSWMNRRGIEIVGSREVSFFGLDVKENHGVGVAITSGYYQNDTITAEIKFYGGVFAANHSWDFYLAPFSGSQNGPSGILIDGCTFAGGSAAVPINDVSQIPFRNVVSNCTFNVYRYHGHKAINKNDIYLFRDCMYTDNKGRGVYANNSMECTEVTSDMPEYQMKPYDGQVLVHPNEDTTNVLLPEAVRVQVGAVFYVTKAESGKPVKVKCSDNQKINGEDCIMIMKEHEAVMITRAGSTWIAAQMLAPPYCPTP